MRNGFTIVTNNLFTISQTRTPCLLMPLSFPPRITNMSSSSSLQDANGKAAGASASPGGPKKLKILMLHGYTQSGPLFHAKTRALEKALQKAFPAQNPKQTKPTPGVLPSYPGGVTLLYPSGPRKLSASDIPGYTPSDLDSGAEKENDWRAWWVRDGNTGEYVGVDEGFQVVADVIKAEGGQVDGVIGFSQGGAASGFVASALEVGRVAAFAEMESKGGDKFPSAFLTAGGGGSGGLVDETKTASVNNGKPLRFAVSYSGFYAPDKRYAAFYEPKIRTPMLHFIGSLDSVVEEDRSLALVERCVDARTVVHPGGHFVPIGKEWVAALIGFIRETCGGSDESAKEEESVEDMEVPF